MDVLGPGLRRLAAARTKDQLVDALWDLRDVAYDEPAAWSAFTAEGFFQGLAAELEEALADDSGQVSTTVIARALAKAVDPRPNRS